MPNAQHERASLIRTWPPKDLTSLQQSLSGHDYGITRCVYTDISLSQGWRDVTLHLLPSPFRPLISGRPSNTATKTTIDTADRRVFIYPVRYDETTSIHTIHDLFEAASACVNVNGVGHQDKRAHVQENGHDEDGQQQNEVRMIMLGIIHTDSTVVYYRINRGITKPTVN